jgi:hypothetical protein
MVWMGLSTLTSHWSKSWTATAKPIHLISGRDLFGPGVALDAFEVREGEPAGHQFQVIGEPEDDPLKLRGDQPCPFLFRRSPAAKLMKPLSVTHLEIIFLPTHTRAPKGLTNTPVPLI